MNTKSLLLAMALVAGATAQAQTKVNVSGEITGITDSCQVSLADIESYQPKRLATVKFKGSHFSLTADVKVPRMVTLNVSAINPKSGKWMRYASVRTMLDATPVTVKFDKEAILADRKNVETESFVNKPESGLVLTGGKVMQEYAEYLDFTRSAEWTSQVLGYAEADAWFKNNGDDNAIAYMKQANAKASAELANRSHEFILLHPDYAVSAALVAARAYKPFSYSIEMFEKEYAAIKNNADTAHVNFITRNIAYFRSHAEGADYTDFVAKDKKGKEVKLSSLRQPGKLTLIDFWASWCGPCRNAIPKVKAMSEKYADKLQVVSCSVDEKKDAWLKAEKEEAMPWTQLILPMSSLDSKTGPGVAYDITSIPRLVVISADGKVLVVTHDPAVVEKVIAENVK